MPALSIPILALIAGLCGLIWGADKFVNGSVGIARSLGVSSLVIGLTVVSIGTSAPEIIVSVNAALKNSGGLAVGNAIGSNLANIGLVLGITALVAPIPVQKHLLYEESPVLLLITALAGLCLYDGQLNRIESQPDKQSVDISSSDMDLDLKQSSLLLFIGLGVLLVGAEVTVWGAKSLALHFGISDLIIGLTVVAIGTSLPELAASVMSAKRGHHDIAIGNIFGSNLFNILLVMTAAGIISPIALSSDVFTRDYIALAAMTLLLVAVVAFALLRGRKNPNGAFVSRLIGVILLSAYFSYYIVLWPSMLVS